MTNLNLLKYFITVAELKNITKAAEKLYISQPALTKAIKQLEEEMGDLLLSVTSLCRKLKIDPEIALNKATDKFINRFEQVEKAVIAEGLNINELNMEQLDAIWDKNKAESSKK